jgi:hypothetical protein
VDSRNPILSCHSPVIPINCGKTMSQTTQPPYLTCLLSLPPPFSTSSFLSSFFSISSFRCLFLSFPYYFSPSIPLSLLTLVSLPLTLFLSSEYSPVLPIPNLNISRSRIFKRVWSPGIDSNESIPPFYIARRRPGTITLFLLGS